MNAKPLMTVVLMSAVFATPAFAGSADEALDAAMSQYRSADARGQWNNPWMPQASGSYVAQAPSGDVQLKQIVAGYTRGSLDRGGWENTVLTNSRYAAGNALLAARVGEGVTSSGEPDARVSADEQLTRIVAAYGRQMLDRGGWENTFLTNSRYAAGNALLAARIGEGVTTAAGAASTPLEAPRVIALRGF